MSQKQASAPTSPGVFVPDARPGFPGEARQTRTEGLAEARPRRTMKRYGHGKQLKTSSFVSFHGPARETRTEGLAEARPRSSPRETWTESRRDEDRLVPEKFS